jgi:hypothetical protein
MTTQNGSHELLDYLISQANSGQKNWFGFQQQKICGINIAYEIAKNHAYTMSPNEVADYAFKLNNAIYAKIVKIGND